MRWSARSPAEEITESPGEPALPPLIVICGATATGKTGFALELAERLPGAEIISADSRQVYRGMDIGTAKVSVSDRARVPHHGLDLADPDEAFTAQLFRRHALETLPGIATRGGVALLVGGTGLYLRAVARGLPLEGTGSDPRIREQIENRLASEGLASLAAELSRVAPRVAAATDLANPRRVTRALERASLLGDRLPPTPIGYPAPSLWLGLTIESKTHQRWIEDRARLQFESGLLQEAAGLARRYDRAARAFSAFGYREAFAVLDGEITREEALEQTIRRTRQFARRQRSWFRSEPDISWLDTLETPLARALPMVDRLLER